jgi:carboxymethylenebutenolidase
MPDLAYPVADGERDGYLATPTAPGPWPAVVVVHEAFGLTDDMRGAADRFAARGYLALAPDLYSAGNTLRCLVATMREVMSGKGGRALADIEAARSFLRDREDTTGKVGVIGFCMGGGFAILAATRGFDASAPSYGMLPDDAESALRGSCPMVGSYGGKDRGLRGAAGRLESALTSLGVDHDVKEYADSGHAFMTPHSGRWAFAERIPGMGGSAADAEDAWQRVFAFFGRHLATDSAAASS